MIQALTQVVRNIRAEADGLREKSIALHFVMSNIPDLDDEHLILKGKISAFKQELDLKHDPMVVHRYDSLSLLNQAVFSRDRPSSRLAKEYNHLVKEIITQNWKDRTGALEYIRRAKRHKRWLDDGSILTREQILEKIERSHPEDGEILYRLAALKDADRDSEAVEQLINQAISHGCDQPEAYLMRSRFRNDSDERIGAAEDAWRVLDSSRIAPQMIREAAWILSKIGKSNPEKLIKSKAVLSLEPIEKIWLAETYNRSRNHLLIAVALCEPIVALPDVSSQIRSASNSCLGVAYIGLGQCTKAARLLRKPNSNIADMSINNAFNYGMACWGIDGKVHREIFERVIEIDQSSNEVNNSANYFQCMSIAYWATDEIGRALDNLNKSRELIIRRRLWSEFSCWQYLEVDAETFDSDLNEIKEMIEKNEIRNPKFLIEADTIVTK